MKQLKTEIISLLEDITPNKAGDRRSWGGLSGSSIGLVLAESTLRHNGLTLVICDSSQTADQLEQQLAFFMGSSDVEILHFPDWETLPYDYFSPHQDIISERLYTLYKLPLVKRAILLVPITTLLHRLPPPEYIAGNSLVIENGQSLPVSEFRRQLEKVGYQCVETVYEHGQFAVRGSIIDIFPMGSTQPYRIELFDEDIESLRTFETESQRTIEKVDSIRLLPAREYPLKKESINAFIDRWHDSFDTDHRQCALYQDVASGIASSGLEYYLPLFFEKTATLFDYLPANTLAVCTENIEQHLNSFLLEVNSRWEQRKVDTYRPILPPARLFLASEEFYSALKHYPRVNLHAQTQKPSAGHFDFPFIAAPDLPINAKLEQPLLAVLDFLSKYETCRVLFCTESPGRREALKESLNAADIMPDEVSDWDSFIHQDSRLGLTIAPLDSGLLSSSLKITLIAENQLFGQRIMQRRRRKKEVEQGDAIVKNLTELRLGAPVVHIDHGVGRYIGLESITIDEQENEFLTLEYADHAKLYVPVSSLHLISRYTGAQEESAPLHKLGSDKWQTAKRKAAEKIRDVAAELLDVYARRAARVGHQFAFDENAYRNFASGFPFEETDDQLTSINAVISDMRAETPMDRLVCGDVGFGKTEVAMRAAFMAVNSDKQVAVLVPTTLLAQQHFETFRDRFADWPVRVEVVSRFRSGKETSQILKGLADGKIDIVIGTHKLIQNDIKFANLGLVVIDEEHRFGVRQKETLKALRAEVDILTLTATPIPRTLNMSMAGMRDLSIIATPPARRLSVKTFVKPYDVALIKEAILREILRGGQVYFLHNEVNTIEKIAQELRELIPEARIGVGHGQLRERDLEQVMSDFYHKRFNILVCTTIIETGIDIPSANTIIINRADKFGLAQLHQLRGRVGRSHHQAYAYLLTPDNRNITADAVKRLEAISEASELGCGFTLATHDLEIRGAGELLGDEQSGQIQTVGFSLYMEMLERAVEAIKSGKTPNIEQPLQHGSEINLRIPALIPDDYLPDVHTRLIMYKRIASATGNEALRELQVEMIDRFGLLPPAVKNLFKVTELKLLAEKMGIEKIETNASGGRLDFSNETTVDPLKIVQLIQKDPATYQLAGGTALKFKMQNSDTTQRVQSVEQVLAHLA